VQYEYVYSVVKKSAPASMVDDFNRMKNKWLVTQEALRKALQSQRADSGAADEAVAKLEWDKTIEFDPIFPDEKTFRGLKNRRGLLTETESARIIFGLFDEMLFENLSLI
jgi:hypothetical protein